MDSIQIEIQAQILRKILTKINTRAWDDILLDQNHPVYPQNIHVWAELTQDWLGAFLLSARPHDTCRIYVPKSEYDFFYRTIRELEFELNRVETRKKPNSRPPILRRVRMCIFRPLYVLLSYVREVKWGGSEYPDFPLRKLYHVLYVLSHDCPLCVLSLAPR